ncbi:hypothetical protein ELQ88_26830 [Pseudomonas sp. MPC6]|nr:hypothetical protein ELQ88_26830 [Pseudomonas sp. MPC6]
MARRRSSGGCRRFDALTALAPSRASPLPQGSREPPVGAGLLANEATRSIRQNPADGPNT